jgi:hypothetical protein
MKLITTLLVILLSISSLFSQNRKDSLLVFVGELIEIKSLPQKSILERIDTIIEGKDTIYQQIETLRSDNGYAAKYKVLQMVYGSYQFDTINFTAFDHYGDPDFATFKTVLLFVSYHKGKLYHEKYQYFDVYKTTDGKWASPGDPYKFDNYHRKDIKAQALTFPKTVFYDLNNYENDKIQEIFPKEHFIIVGQKAFPKTGTYIDDLFKVKKEGVLKARGIFE